jgi:hypothetical protein
MELKSNQKPLKLMLLELQLSQELPEILAPLLEEGLDREQLCARLGSSRRTVDNWLALYDLKLSRRYRLVSRKGE